MNAQQPRDDQPVTIPSALQDVTLIDAKTCAAVGSMSVSWWHEEVRAGRAPQPVIRQPRFTRWRVVDVRAFWAARIETGMVRAKEVIAKANMATRAASAKRSNSTAPGA
ncbi:MAG: helix-turn-helix transcriptional regulator [Vitreoscilla sp.]